MRHSKPNQNKRRGKKMKRNNGTKKHHFIDAIPIAVVALVFIGFGLFTIQQLTNVSHSTPTFASAAISVSSFSAVPSSINASESSVLTAGPLSGGTGIYTYKWYEQSPSSGSYSQLSDGQNSSGTIVYGSSTKRLVFIASRGAATGTYNLKLKVTDSAGSTTNSSAVSIHVYPINNTWPSKSNTGVPAGTDLVPELPNRDINSGQTIDSMVFYLTSTGGLYFEGLNDVTFQRDEFTQNWSSDSGSSTDEIEAQTSFNIVYQDDWFNATAAGSANPCSPAGILYCYGGSDSVKRSYFNGLGQDFFIENDSTYVGNYGPDIVSNCGDHAENIYVWYTVNDQVRHNNFGNNNDQTSTIYSGTYGTQYVINATFDDNLLYGGGYTTYTPGGPESLNNTYSNNYFATTYYPQAGYYGPVDNAGFVQGINSSSGNVWQDNVWSKNNTILTPQT
jgi:hypothetical protein